MPHETAEKKKEEKEEVTEEVKKSVVEVDSVFDEKKFIDCNKMACLLCKRGFDSVELLNKHVQISALHKVRF